ncbi:MAG: glycosyltransferase family 2 protein [Pseudoalteromonas prydzensis]|uniref:glycosyltransferase family 2 protein n=1 Tax=Pseudoalteromonas prydzensis TaxID=182141 RepID=UPI003F970C55
MILVSVIIPFYSSTTGLLTKAVESALSQTIENLEVIIIDDCSPVSGAKELELINDDRVRIIRHSKNSNGGIARNTGIDNANGEFIAFLDYDDLWYANKLEKQLAYWHTIGDDSAVIYCQCKVIDGKRVFNRPERGIAPQERVGDYLFASKQIIQTSGIFLPANLAKMVKFHDLKRHQDYQFCLSLEAEGATFHYLNEVLYEFIQIPKLNNYHFSLNWMNNYQQYLSPNAMLGFKKLVVLRSMIAHGEYLNSLKYSIKNKILTVLFKVLIIKLAKKILYR